MTRGAMILAGILAAATGVSVWTSYTGAGVPQPVDRPPSIREGSVRAGPLRSGRTRTRYFVGGGLHGAK